METATEAARRTVNALLDRTGSKAAKAAVWPLSEPEIFAPLVEFDRVRFRLGLPHAEALPGV